MIMIRLSKLGALMRSHFLAGLLVIVPIGVIAWILGAAMGMLWRLQEVLPDAWRPSSVLAEAPAFAALLNAAFTVAATLALALGISILGWASKHFLGRKVLETIGSLINRIPVVRSIYSALDQLLRTMSASGGQQFSRVVYVEYPRKGIWALAFVTGPAKGPAVPPGHLNIYVPTTPNPTSGFHLLVPENEVRESHMKVEAAFRTILSLGIAQPSERGHGG
jgi:uncharacterized membrane protein